MVIKVVRQFACSCDNRSYRAWPLHTSKSRIFYQRKLMLYKLAFLSTVAPFQKFQVHRISVLRTLQQFMFLSRCKCRVMFFCLPSRDEHTCLLKMLCYNQPFMPLPQEEGSMTCSEIFVQIILLLLVVLLIIQAWSFHTICCIFAT